MRRLSNLLFLTILTSHLYAQTNYEKFKKLFKDNDTTKIKTLLIEWEKTNPNDAELYTSAINYYFTYGSKEMMVLSNGQRGKEGFKLTDSTGEIKGMISSEVSYNSDKVSKAIKYASIGIEKFPDRLDIRFGKCYVLKQIGDYNNFTKELIKTIEFSQANKNNWLWTENKKQEDGEDFMLGTIQTYLKELYDTEDDNLLPNMIQIGEATIKYYKNNVEILSTTSVALLLTKNYDKAIEYLKQAEKINPKDFIVLNNIAEAYRLKDDKTNAIKYYELTEKYGDEEAKKQAKQKIKDLKK